MRNEENNFPIRTLIWKPGLSSIKQLEECAAVKIIANKEKKKSFETLIIGPDKDRLCN